MEPSMFVRKPTTAKAEKFTVPAAPPAPVFSDIIGWYVITIHNDRIPVDVGDWIVWEDPQSADYAYPVKAAVFESAYESITEGE